MICCALLAYNAQCPLTNLFYDPTTLNLKHIHCESPALVVVLLVIWLVLKDHYSQSLKAKLSKASDSLNESQYLEGY